MTTDLRRRTLLRGLAVAALVAAAPATWAQDAQSVAAQKVAREWLAVSDATLEMPRSASHEFTILIPKR